MPLSGSDFLDRPYRIPNQVESKDLERWIEAQEKSLLIDLLGYDLYAEYAANIETSSIDERFEKLIDGEVYTYEGKTYGYPGINEVLKPAVYSRWLDPNTYKLTNVGYTINDPTPNSTVLNHEEFVVQAWNEFVKLVGSDCSRKGTLYGFLKSSEDYPELCFTEQKLRNRYGL